MAKRKFMKKEKERKNPFYNNYVFTKKDLDRPIIKRFVYPFLWFLPTYTQVNEDMFFILSIGKEKYFNEG